MSRILSIDCRLSAPPNRPLVFRDTTLYAKVFLHFDLIVSPCPFNEWDHYAGWFRRYGLFDFVDGLVRPGEINADVLVEDGQGRLDEAGLAGVIAALRRFGG